MKPPTWAELTDQPPTNRYPGLREVAKHLAGTGVGEEAREALAEIAAARREAQMRKSASLRKSRQLPVHREGPSTDRYWLTEKAYEALAGPLPPGAKLLHR
jgi:hypothetical protein